MDANDYDSEIMDLYNIINLDPFDKEAYIDLCRLYHIKNDDASAAETLSKAINLEADVDKKAELYVELRYYDNDYAPVVQDKGQIDDMILKKYKAHKIPLVRKSALARSIYAEVEKGEYLLCRYWQDVVIIFKKVGTKV
jgi:type III secretory pathway component EscU